MISAWWVFLAIPVFFLGYWIGIVMERLGAYSDWVNEQERKKADEISEVLLEELKE